LVLKHAGYDVRLAVADGQGDEVWNGIPIHDMGKPTDRLRRMLLLPWQAIAAVRKSNPTVVHFHDPELLPAAIILRLLGKTVIYDAHEDLPRSIKSRRWLGARLLKVVSLIAEKIENLCVRSMSAVVAATPHIASRFALLNDRVAVVRNYPDLSRIPVQMQRLPEPATFCYVGAISLHRGVLEMIRAIELTGARLIMAGPFGDDHLQAKVSHLPEWKNVEYLGPVPYEQVWTIMQRSHAGLLFLHPVPNYVDSLPVKLFEYMAAGLPILCSDYAGWPDIVRKEGIGYLADPTDPQAIAAVMRKILDDPEAAEAMGRRARAIVLERYSWQAEAEKLLALYQTVLANRPGAAARALKGHG
jgi:glycosyltransferase involved in cell wall biosynthesis